jgi:hypothetical protein
MTPPQIPDHVAAYAAGLWSWGEAKHWGEVTEIIERLGLGSYRYDKLARKALDWLRANVDPAARRLIRRRRAALAPRRNTP